MGIMGTGSSRSLDEATSLQPHAAKRAKTDSDTGMRTVAPSSAGGSRSRIRAGCNTPLPPPARRRITGKTQQRTYRPGGVEIRAKSLGDNSDDAGVGDSRGAACGDDLANSGLRAAEWMSPDHAPPSQQRQRQRQVPAGSLSGGPDDGRTLNARRAEDECNAANGGQLEAGWLSLDLTPPSQKQAGGMSGDHPLPPQKPGQQLDRDSKHQ